MPNSFNGTQLRLARIFNGFALEEVAGRVGLSRQYIYKLETNQGTPTPALCSSLAEALNVLPSFFEQQQNTAIPDKQVHFRKLFTTRSTVRQEALVRAEMFVRLVNYLDKHLRLPAVNIPEVEVETMEDIERAAENCRHEWGLGYGPIQSMTRLAENVGVLVTTFRGISAEIDALSVVSHRPVIVRNEAKPGACRQRFDVGHELGHFVLHTGRETGDRLSESEANRFAGAFLVPRAMMAKLFPRWSGTRLNWRAIAEFKQTWKMSKAALLYRARQLDLITDGQYKTGVITLRRGGEATREREDDSIPQEQPELLRRALEILAQHKQIYSREIAQALCIRENLLENLAGLAVPRAPAKPHLRLVA
jgi:Zn-dependent peptidase ImmA (M78 family)/transcriptional regulator with XRE-family HTH domain